MFKKAAIKNLLETIAANNNVSIKMNEQGGFNIDSEPPRALLRPVSSQASLLVDLRNGIYKVAGGGSYSPIGTDDYRLMRKIANVNAVAADFFEIIKLAVNSQRLLHDAAFGFYCDKD